MALRLSIVAVQAMAVLDKIDAYGKIAARLAELETVD
jgi:hypothetical protein